MVICSVSGCTSKYNKSYLEKGISFFSFPKNQHLARQWVNACGGNKTDKNLQYARVCSLHFRREDWTLRDQLIENTSKKPKLKDDAVPSLNLPNIVVETDRSKQDRGRTIIVEKCLEEYNKIKQSERELSESCQAVNFPHTTSFPETCESEMEIKIKTENEIERRREFQIKQIERENRLLAKRIAKSNKQLTKAKAFETYLGEIFTEGQIKKLKYPFKKLKWNTKDINTAIAVYATSTRTYSYLYKKKFPLPGPSTLRRAASRVKLKIQPGILTDVFQLMTNSHLADHEKVCILSLDEMKVKKSYQTNRAKNKEISNYVQIVIARGLLKNWKQPVFYNFDCRMTYSIIAEIIKKLDSINYKVVALVADLGANNDEFWEELNITTEKTWFVNPADDSLNVYVFVDVPHLLQLLKNQFLDNGFVLNNKHINSGPVKELVNLDKSFDRNMIHNKITKQHLSFTGCKRLNLNLAIQLFSQSVAMSIRKANSLGLCISSNAVECADFIETVNDWFDVFNSKTTSKQSRSDSKRFEISIEDRIEIIQSFSEIVDSIRAPEIETLLPLQKGIIISNRSLEYLYKYLKEMYGIDFILTNRLNRVMLEKVFIVLRTKGGLCDYPTPREFQNRLRNYILGNSYFSF